MKKDYFLGASEEGFHRVSYFEWGENNPTHTPIICVHGLTRNAHDFDSLAAYLSDHGEHLYCPDMVGRGDSDWFKNPLHYTYEQYIADMAALIARSGATSIDWIGTSMGGLIGMALASMENSPIRALVLNDIGPQIALKGLSRLATYVGAEPIFPSLESAKNYFKTIYTEFGPLTDAEWQYLTETTVREIAPQQFVSKLDPHVKLSPPKSKLIWKALTNPHKALEGTFFDIDLWDIWRKVTCPVLVIHGAHSELLLPETLCKMQQTHAKTEIMEVTDAGHAPALLKVSQFEKIHAWLVKWR